ncbi:TIGR03016 family PEP-CTERM system-associated outer membrane protein [Thalassotalea euphylliae]|nr:TIGR03016 family PEP-CTERM system-associated outer membrane protein [Thalassotalea euphylliae]
MAITDMATAERNKLKLSSLFGVTLLLAHPEIAHAASNELSPYIGIEEIYSDNVELSSFNEENSFVTRANVGVRNNYSSSVVDASINGNYSHLFYSHDSSADNGYESLNSTINISPWRKGPQLNLSGTIANTPQSIGGNFASDLISGDTVRTTNYGAGLSYSAQNSDFLLTLGGQYNDSRSEDDVGSSYGYATSLGFQNGTGQKFVFWNISASYSDRNNQRNSARSYQIQATVGLISGWKLNPFIRYFDENYSGSVTNNNLNQGESLGAGIRWQPAKLMVIDLSYNKAEDEAVSDDYVAFEFSWQPTTRTQIAANYNQRFFGDSYGLNINHRNKRLTNAISYNEQVQAFQRDNFELFVDSTVFCPVGQPIDLEECLPTLEGQTQPELFVEFPIFDIRPVEDNQFSLNKRLAWSSSLSLPRTTLGLTISGNEREDLNTGNTQDVISININANRRLNPRSNITAGFQFSRNDFFTRNVDIDAERKDYYRSYNLGYSLDFARSLSLNFNLRHLVRSSNFDIRSYDETRATLSVRKDF